MEAKFVTIYDWMLELELSSTEVSALAVIYSFRKKDGGWFTGSASYVAKWMSRHRNTATTALASLVKKGLLERRERWANGEKNVDFRVTQKLCRGIPNNCAGGCPKSVQHIDSSDKYSSDNLKEINNKEIHLTVEEFINQHKH